MKKWDGTPMLEFDEQGHVINQEKKRRGARRKKMARRKRVLDDLLP